MASSRHSKRARSKSESSGEPPEILQQVGRAVLAYTLKKLSERQAKSEAPAESRSRSVQRKSSRTRARDPSSASGGSSSRDLRRSDNDDVHALISQLVVGAFGFGIRALVRRRKEAKKKKAAAAAAAAAAAQSGRRPTKGRHDVGTYAVDPELSAALDSVTAELQNASDSIRRLAHSAPPPSHRDCAVRDALITNADRLTGSLANMQASINNMRNLHPGLAREMGRKDRAGEIPKERTSTRERTQERGQNEGGTGDWARERRRKLRAEEAREKSRTRERAEEERRARGRSERSEHAPRSEKYRDHREHRWGYGKPEERPRRYRSRRRDESMPRSRRSEPMYYY